MVLAVELEAFVEDEVPEVLEDGAVCLLGK